jgi:ParB family chromosome partitioning protein
MLGGGYLVNAPIKSITVPENRLRELRDFSGLAASVDELGLWQPITVTESGVLVSGRHRLEAAKSLGWEKIPAFVVEDDELRNRLTEIDENLKRLDLTVYEQSKHAAERERVLEALGQRAKEVDTDASLTRHGVGVKTTAEIAQEAGMSEKSWQRRAKVGRSLGPATTAVLDQADPTEEKHRNFLNSTTQLNHIADISNKRGDEVAAEVARKVLTEGEQAPSRLTRHSRRRLA